jgi:hypothetical protein
MRTDKKKEEDSETCQSSDYGTSDTIKKISIRRIQCHQEGH